jgi:transcriptional regulator with XRE-family HTH domain
MMSDQQQEALAEAVQKVLTDRNLSVNSASQRTKLDRNTLKRFTLGIPPVLEKLEQFARALQLDVNEWRVKCGYPTVGMDARLQEGVERIVAEVGEHFTISTEDLTVGDATPEGIDAKLARIRERALARKASEQ